MSHTPRHRRVLEAIGWISLAVAATACSSDDSNTSGGAGGADATAGGNGGGGSSSGGSGATAGGGAGGSAAGSAGGGAGGAVAGSGGGGTGGAAAGTGGGGAGGAAAGAGGSAGADAGPDATADASVDASTDGAMTEAGPDAADTGVCNDADPTTTDSLHPVYGCAHQNGVWITFDSGLEVDTSTGWGWSPVQFNHPYDYFAPYCDGLVLAGLDQWHFATIDESRSLAGGCANTESSGSCPISDPSCLDSTCGYSASCASCTGGGGPNGAEYCRAEVPMCLTMWTASLCTDCSDSASLPWVYGVTNGNFFTFLPSIFHGRCVVSNVPNL